MKRALPSVLLALLAHAQSPSGDDASCKVCHPGATAGLRQSVHASLLPRANLCTACHGDLSAHAAAPGKFTARVAATACNSCHAGAARQPASGAHALQATGSGALPQLPSNALIAPGGPGTDAAPAAGLQFEGLLQLGYRMVHHSGSRQGYITDVDLDPGLRLADFELRGRGNDSTAVDDVALRAHDLGDPHFDVSATARKTGQFDLAASYRGDRYRYRADGDYHKVDRDSETFRTDASFDLGGGLRLFANYSHSTDDSIWLTQRIGNRNLPVQTVVSDVDSPRHLDSDEGELGLQGLLAGWNWTLAAGYYEQHDRATWSFAQPAVANPAFVESEDFAQHTTLHGPQARFALQRDCDCLRFGLAGRIVDHDRSVAADGTATGFDLGPFTTSTTASGSGHARTMLLDADASLQLTASLHLDADLHWRDHEEHMDLLQTDVSVYPTLPSTIAVTTAADNDTVQRLFDGALSLGLSPSKDLDLAVGYGFAREQLRVPALQPADPQDFHRGHSRDDGVLASARWQPIADWTLRADLRDFGQDGVPLHELVPEHARSTSGSLGWQHDGRRAAVFARHRRNDNDVSDHHLDALTLGCSAGITTEPLSFDLGYSFARTDSRTLTNFYFDPDPAPVPTFVGFEGDTHTVTGSLSAVPFRDWRAGLAAAFTTTTGSFDVLSFDWHAELEWRATAAGTAGIELRQLRYQDDSNDDWRAELLTVYWRQQW